MLFFFTQCMLLLEKGSLSDLSTKKPNSHNFLKINNEYYKSKTNFGQLKRVSLKKKALVKGLQKDEIIVNKKQNDFY